MEGIRPTGFNFLPSVETEEVETPEEHQAEPVDVRGGLAQATTQQNVVIPRSAGSVPTEAPKPSSPWKAMLAAAMAQFPHEFLRVSDQGAARPGSGDGVYDLIARMVIETPSEGRVRQLADEVRPLGVGLLSGLERFRVSIVILRHDMKLTEFTVRDMHVVMPEAHTADGQEYEKVRGFYRPSLRLILVGEEELGGETALHEFGHAWDHAYSEESRLSTPVSVQLWNRFSDTRTGVVDPYAEVNPGEYFAVCFEAWFGKERARLAELDPDMACFLESLPAIQGS